MHLARKVVFLALLTGCSARPAVDPAAFQPPQPAVPRVPDVRVGDTQQVRVADSFGPGSEAVPARVTVFAVRDHVARAITPITPGTHWASADVRVCRSAPVVLGYPAWVLGDEVGRTAQQSRVLHPQFPQPALPAGAGSAGCTRGWVTWVVAADLHPTRVSFEQTRDVPGAWRLP